jgi:ketosteroid isomerase-like protein
VRLFYEVFDFRRASAGDFDELFRRHAAPGFELRLPAAYPDLENQRGLDALNALFRMFKEIWDEWRHEPEAWTSEGENVVVLVTLVSRGKESGVEVRTPAVHLWRLREGLVESVEVGTDRDAALASAGLSKDGLKPWPEAAG